MEFFGKNEMHVVCLLDGKPGHEKQSLGIIQALRKQIPIKVTEIKIGRRSLWDFFWGMVCLDMPSFISLQPEVENPDFLIGTGSRTHLSTLLYKKKYHIPAVTCMVPDQIYRSRFDICFAPVHDGFKQKGNIITTVGPPNCSIDRGIHKEKNGLILLGGIDSKSHSWNSRDIVEKVKNIIQREPETEWLISSSPRTPDDTILKFEEISLHHPNVFFYNYKDTQPGWVEQQYDNAVVVWVTADSVSMMFEALTAGCKVGVIPVDWKKKINKFEKSVAFLVDNNFVLPYEEWLGGKGDWLEHDALNEAQKCADIIITRWWKKNL